MFAFVSRCMLNASIWFASVLIAVIFLIVEMTMHVYGLMLEYIDSIEYPLFVQTRQFLEKYSRMFLFYRTHNRVGYDEEAIKRGDEYIDKLLENMFKNGSEEYDPYVLEDSVVGFYKKVVFVNVSGEAKLHQGYIKGLSTLHRAGHCSLQNEGDKLKVKADLGAGELDLHYSGSVKFMNFGPTITVQGTLSYIEVYMEFTFDSKTGKDGKLTSFIIDDMRGMKVWVTGLGPLNWAINPIIKGVTKIFKRFVRNFMEHKVEKHIRDHIPNFEFPVEGGDNTESPETTPAQTPSETEAPEETTPPETLAPETEAPEETTPPETLAPETEAPEETIPPETLAPETEAPEETIPPEPETLAPETEAPDESNLDVEPTTPHSVDEIKLPETPDTFFVEETLDELEDELDSESEYNLIIDTSADSETSLI